MSVKFIIKDLLLDKNVSFKVIDEKLMIVDDGDTVIEEANLDSMAELLTEIKSSSWLRSQIARDEEAQPRGYRAILSASTFVGTPNFGSGEESLSLRHPSDQSSSTTTSGTLTASTMGGLTMGRMTGVDYSGGSLDANYPVFRGYEPPYQGDPNNCASEAQQAPPSGPPESYFIPGSASELSTQIRVNRAGIYSLPPSTEGTMIINSDHDTMIFRNGSWIRLDPRPIARAECSDECQYEGRPNEVIPCEVCNEEPMEEL